MLQPDRPASHFHLEFSDAGGGALLATAISRASDGVNLLARWIDASEDDAFEAGIELAKAGLDPAKARVRLCSRNRLCNQSRRWFTVPCVGLVGWHRISKDTPS